MILAEDAWIISVSVVLVGSIMYCIYRIEHAADRDNDSISELLV